MADARLTFGLLGCLEVKAGGRPVELVGTKPKALLVVLLASANRVVAADRLVDDLWAGRPTPGASATLQGYVSELRKALADATGVRAPIVTRRPGYLIEVDVEQVDLLRFERLIAQAQDRAGKSFDEIGGHLLRRQRLPGVRVPGPQPGAVRRAGRPVGQGLGADVLGDPGSALRRPPGRESAARRGPRDLPRPPRRAQPGDPADPAGAGGPRGGRPRRGDPAVRGGP